MLHDNKYAAMIVPNPRSAGDSYLVASKSNPNRSLWYQPWIESVTSDVVKYLKSGTSCQNHKIRQNNNKIWQNKTKENSTNLWTSFILSEKLVKTGRPNKWSLPRIWAYNLKIQLSCFPVGLQEIFFLLKWSDTLQYKIISLKMNGKRDVQI